MPEWLAVVVAVGVVLVVFGGVVALCLWTVPWGVGRLFPDEHASPDSSLPGVLEGGEPRG